MAGIYIHIPFCKQACHYCNFHFSTTLHLKTKLIDSIVKEISLRKDFFSELTEKDQFIDTIYFGGGTPSILSKEELSIILEKLFKNFKISPNVEITLEANPDDLTIQLLKDLKSLNISRLSIGIQSLNDEHLSYMNRAHNAEEAIQCLQTCFDLGFENLNIDLIYGLPNLTTKVWEHQLDIISAFPIHHISAYALTVEPNTALHNFIRNKKVEPIKDEVAAEQFLITSQYLESLGFEHYEISNYARNNAYSKHNTSYWNSLPYLGIGPSAHSYIHPIRSWNVANNSKYIKSISENANYFESEQLSKEDQINEYLMTGLRTANGVSLRKIEENFGLNTLQHIFKELKQIENDYYFIDKNWLKLTRKGWLWCDYILEKLILT